MSAHKIIVVIPARMASTRFSGKILYPLLGYPMIEHVRRRAKLSERIMDVIVATCDNEIAEKIEGYGGKVVMTGNYHLNGTTRIAEALENIDCSHVILLQGDEPLINPLYVDLMVDAIEVNPSIDAWNGTGPLNTLEAVDRNSFVKCAIGQNNRILYCFRRGPSQAEFILQQEYIRKLLGVIAFNKEFLAKLVMLPSSRIEEYESIEQMRIIENGYTLQSVTFNKSLPSVNEPSDVNEVLEYLKNDLEQKALLMQTFGLDIK